MTRMRWLLVFLLLPLCASARPPAVIPANDATVIETLPRGFSAIMPGVKRTAPSLATVERMLETAARTGDARLVARAEADLLKLMRTRPTAAHMQARAHIAQYRHDFAQAQRWLDRAIELEPRAADSRLARAQILLVQGDIKRARRECTALALTVDAGHGLLCVASVAIRDGDYARAIRLLDLQLKQGGAGAELRRHVLVMRAEAASRRGDPDATQWFARALSAAHGDVRTLAAMSRHLRGAGRPLEAYRLLANAPSTDHLLLERALAAQEAGTPDAPVLAAALERRFAATRAVGATPDPRDEALYELSLRKSPVRALRLAQQNFAEQRDHEDVQLLAQAATAARDRKAWQPVESWARAQELSVPGLQGLKR